ncbi:hypothetical protein ACN2XU_03445 [Primorskyibacter sp. 2E107]|uniref:hypothetical protein n=1 Tax=Primorskyibacter sp. 2E107 TaxID=3403458 RepID=UPI003AF96A72
MNVSQPSAVTSVRTMELQARQPEPEKPIRPDAPEQDNATRADFGGKEPVTDSSGSYGDAAAAASSALSFGGGQPTMVWEKADAADDSKDATQKIQETGKQIAAKEGFGASAQAGQTAGNPTVDILA